LTILYLKYDICLLTKFQSNNKIYCGDFHNVFFDTVFNCEYQYWRLTFDSRYTWKNPWKWPWH